MPNTVKLPTLKEIEADLRKYISDKYGARVQLQVPLTPIPDAEPVDDGAGERDSPEAPSLLARLDFDLTPAELVAHLDRYVVGQEEAKDVLATKICTHYRRIQRALSHGEDLDDVVGNIKNNIILIGPTGVGKTFLIKLIAQRLGVPFVKGDATKFSETGYVGGDVEDLVRDLVREADDDIALAQYGIIFIDEIDKIASSANLMGADVSRTGVQRALLKPMEETEVEMRVAHDMLSQMQAVAEFQRSGKAERKTVNTRHILFIVSGAFQGLEELIRQRVHRGRLGFETDVVAAQSESDLLSLVKAEDLMKYGFESEFIGRLPVIAILHSLSSEHLYQILAGPTSALITAKKGDFRAYDIDLRFEDDALRLLAEQAHEEHTGARGLVRVIERALLKFERTLPSTAISRLLVTSALVEKPAENLQRLLASPDSPEWASRFETLAEVEKQQQLQQIAERQAEFTERFGAPMSPPRMEIVADLALKRRISIDRAIDEVRALHRSIQTFEAWFTSTNEVALRFTEAAIDRLTALAIEAGQSPFDLALERFRSYQHGVKLLQDRKGLTELLLEAEAVDDPERYLNTLIQEMYR